MPPPPHPHLPARAPTPTPFTHSPVIPPTPFTPPHLPHPLLQVTITPAFSGGGLVPGLWSGDPTLAYKQWVECPTGPMTILKDADTKTDVQTALSAFVYGWDETAGVKANRPLEIVSLDFKDNLDRVNTAPAESFLGGQGLVTITVNTPTATPVIDGLIFAITYVRWERWACWG